MSKLKKNSNEYCIIERRVVDSFSYLPQKKVQPIILNGCLAHRRDWIFSTVKLYQFDFKRFNSVSEFKNATLLSETSTIYEFSTNREDNYETASNLI